MTVQTRPYCVYCGATGALTPSCLIPDGTLYRGVQMMCADARACHQRIHDGYHAEAAAPECDHCTAAAGPATRASHA